MREKLQYHADYKPSDEFINDIFDGEIYKTLCDTFVSIDGVQRLYKFFETSCELALGLSVDGMCPFKKQKHSCWLLILVNYNLPPDICTHLENVICVGVVPGPNSPKDLNSFLQPLIDDPLKLVDGVKAVDVLNEEIFILCGHLLIGFGDIPALTKLLELLGHNTRYPWRFCLIRAIQGRTSCGGTHLYCPLHRHNGPSVDPWNLPLRTHNGTIEASAEVLHTPNAKACRNLAIKSGVKGVLFLARLPSIEIPRCFPTEIMHMIWINLVPQLVNLWIGKFNKIGEGKEKYRISSGPYSKLGDICSNSGLTIPTSFGCCVPHLSKHSTFTAESWCMFAMHIAPNILCGHFQKPTYYVHFVKLINLLQDITDYAIACKELPRIWEGFVD
ncbi:hypothetical protein FRC09_012480 [Ceratobasidium sp. 395]|nr:hypothetical protein FRC09_012480 [Ceratobasidium sp. 395]